MENKWIYAIFGVLLLGGFAYATVVGAAVLGTEDERGRWYSGGADSVVTEGGNISGVNVSVATLTDRWAAFFGNVTGSLVLRDNASNDVYVWQWAPTSGGRVCVNTGGTFNWGAFGAGSAANVDSFFDIGTATDSATNTMSTTSCTLSLNGASYSSLPNVTDNSGFDTCVVEEGGATTKDDLAFCTEMNSSGQNYLGEAYNYELMVPTNKTNGSTETYFFFLELD